MAEDHGYHLTLLPDLCTVAVEVVGMGPAAATGKEWFTVPQVARILGVGKQTLYDAVKDGRMNAAGEGWDRRIHAEDVFRYALRTGRTVDDVAKSMMVEKQNEITWHDILGWGLVAAGLLFLYAMVKKDE